MQALQQLQHQLPQLAVDLFRLGLWLLLLASIFVPLERLWALRPQKILRSAIAADLAYYFINSLLPKLCLILPLTLVASALHHLIPVGFYSWMANHSPSVRLVAAILVAEFGTYWGHRWMHRVPCLWYFHAIHHSAKEMDWLVNTRGHPLDIVFTRLCGLLPIYILGLAQPTANAADIVPLLVSVVGTLWGFFIHANLRWRLGWLESVVTTPAFHHWHHSKDAASGFDKNYAAMLPWMDRLFGTFHLPQSERPSEFGIHARA